jgi:hypothetical protein
LIDIKRHQGPVADNSGIILVSEGRMRAHLLVLAGMLFTLSANADSGEEIFNRKCSQCHSFAMAQAMLAPLLEASRPAHLRTFLETHPPMLDDSEKDAVIEALSRQPD